MPGGLNAKLANACLVHSQLSCQIINYPFQDINWVFVTDWCHSCPCFLKVNHLTGRIWVGQVGQSHSPARFPSQSFLPGLLSGVPEASTGGGRARPRGIGGQCHERRCASPEAAGPVEAAAVLPRLPRRCAGQRRAWNGTLGFASVFVEARQRL